jgi:hypothetical protein
MYIVPEDQLAFQQHCSFCNAVEQPNEFFRRERLGPEIDISPIKQAVQLMYICGNHESGIVNEYLDSFLKNKVCGGNPHLAPPNLIKVMRSNGQLEDGFSVSVIPERKYGENVFLCYKKEGIYVTLKPATISDILKWNPQPQL